MVKLDNIYSLKDDAIKYTVSALTSLLDYIIRYFVFEIVKFMKSETITMEYLKLSNYIWKVILKLFLFMVLTC